MFLILILIINLLLIIYFLLHINMCFATPWVYSRMFQARQMFTLLYTAALYNCTLPTQKPVYERERETPSSFSEATRSMICVAWKRGQKRAEGLSGVPKGNLDSLSKKKLIDIFASMTWHYAYKTLPETAFDCHSQPIKLICLKHPYNTLEACLNYSVSTSDISSTTNRHSH